MCIIMTRDETKTRRTGLIIIVRRITLHLISIYNAVLFIIVVYFIFMCDKRPMFVLYKRELYTQDTGHRTFV